MSEYKATEADRAQVERDPMNSMELATLSDLRDFVMPARLIARVLAERRVFKAKVDEAALAEVSLRADRDRLARDAGISTELLAEVTRGVLAPTDDAIRERRLQLYSRFGHST